jgi:sulfur carrier protein ThiS
VRVQIKLLAAYRKYLPLGTSSSSYDLEIPPATRLEHLLAELPVPQDMGKVVLVNGLGVQSGQILQEGDVVCLFPAVAGG